jgi:hypothetical protein
VFAGLVKGFLSFVIAPGGREIDNGKRKDNKRGRVSGKREIV